MPTETSTNKLGSKYPKYQATPTMISKPPILDAMDISTETTTDNTTDIPLFAGNTKITTVSTDNISKKSILTMVDKNTKERKSENNLIIKTPLISTRTTT